MENLLFYGRLRRVVQEQVFGRIPGRIPLAQKFSPRIFRKIPQHVFAFEGTNRSLAGTGC